MWTVVRLILSTTPYLVDLRMQTVESLLRRLLKNASVADAIAIIGGGATGEDVIMKIYVKKLPMKQLRLLMKMF
jgi:hypothetical protein